MNLTDNSDLDLKVLEEIDLPLCEDYLICRERHCAGYGKVKCKDYFKRRLNKVQIPCMSYRGKGN